MARRTSWVGFWLILVLLAAGCESIVMPSDRLPGPRAALSTLPASLPTRANPVTATAAATLTERAATASPTPPPQPARSSTATVTATSSPTPLPKLGAALASIPATFKEYFNIPYAQAPNTDPNLLSLDIYSPLNATGAHPIMIYIHGGGWSTGDKKDVNHKPQFFVNAGFVFVSVNYRLTPKVKFPTHAYDVAEAVAWIFKNIARYGGDPQKINLIGHSAGAHLAVLISSDERYLLAQGLSLKNIRSVISLDTAGYNLNVFADRCKGSKLPEPYGATFGQVPADLKAASPATYIEPGKNIPPMVLAFSGDVGIGSSVSREMMAREFSQSLQQAGIAHALEGAPQKNHSEISTDFGLSGDILSEKILASLKKIAPGVFQP